MLPTCHLRNQGRKSKTACASAGLSGKSIMTSLGSPSENPCFFGCFEGGAAPRRVGDPEDLQQARIQGKLSWLRAVSRQMTFRPLWPPSLPLLVSQVVKLRRDSRQNLSQPVQILGQRCNHALAPLGVGPLGARLLGPGGERG